MANPNPKPPPVHTRWKKGQSGNPKGSVKLPDIREALAKVLADEKDGITALEATLAALRRKAVQGDVRAAEVLMDRAFGKAKQSLDVDHTTGGQPIPTAIKIELVTPPTKKK
jgi:alkylation response protein AidB-like acyl-CoA dehydrogenase